MQSSNTGAKGYTWIPESAGKCGTCPQQRHTHTTTPIHTQGSGERGQWPQVRVKLVPVLALVHRIWHRFCEHLTEEGLHCPSLETFKYKYCGCLSPFYLVINTYRCVCENRLSDKATSKHNKGGKTWEADSRSCSLFPASEEGRVLIQLRSKVSWRTHTSVTAHTTITCT